MPVRQAVPAVITANARFDEAGAISVAAARQRQLLVTGMRTPGPGGRNPMLLFRPPMSGDRVAYQRAQLVFGHDGR
jgi:hypothetical protein